ncbi:MAG TPA: hypothetical protein PLG15_00630 [Candidatus Gastranaerophilaceae bacterium]|nr:hypothetical protein [Candidatus Gastranaerophilaceae bacterium]HPT40872.1 hypothetical protein [Candidatus Gastranaerophilaceae bacterium]
MAVNVAKFSDFAEEEFFPQNKGEISDSITQNWTEQALECYRLNCDCSKCSISKGQYSFACQMPKVLELLVSIAGKPSVAEI